MGSNAMKKEIEEIGCGYKANCWCTHGCWILSSIVFNPLNMLSKVYIPSMPKIVQTIGFY